MLVLNAAQNKHKIIDEQLCAICEKLVGFEDSAEVKQSVADSLKAMVILSPTVNKAVNELVDALDKNTQPNIDLCRKNLHWALVGYRTFYENSENF